MPQPARLETARLILRPWEERDRAPFAALNADPGVMETLPAMMSRAESDAMIDRIMVGFTERGWGWFAVERKSDGAFLGATGLGAPSFKASFTPCVELAWRQAREFWGQGYVSEAARECARYAFDGIGEARIYAFTTPENARSRAVMERIGMAYVPNGDFDHPNLPEGHRLRRHVLYHMDARDMPRKA
jgi:RimJ/RimL family protein N-acetyltransferase